MEEKTYIVRGVPAGFVEKVWPFAEPYVKRALDHTHGEMTHLDILKMCVDRNAQLWLIYNGQRMVGAGTTEIVIYPQKKVARIITIAGNEFDEWKQMADDVISAWARELGCTDLQCLVRVGFVKKLKEIGYKNRYCICDRPI